VVKRRFAVAGAADEMDLEIIPIASESRPRRCISSARESRRRTSSRWADGKTGGVSCRASPSIRKKRVVMEWLDRKLSVRSLTVAVQKDGWKAPRP